MRKFLVVFGLLVAFLFVMSGPALAKLFIVEIDGKKIIVDFWVKEEQAWQYSPSDTPGWWEGLAPHPYKNKIWYPHMSDMFDMDYKQQFNYIKRLFYAGIYDWRMAGYWDVIPLHSSVFQQSLVLNDFNNAAGLDTSIYFNWTGSAPGPFDETKPVWMVHGRTIDEDGLKTGAIINAKPDGLMGMPNAQHYLNYGDTFLVPGRIQYFTMPRDIYNGESLGSGAQDHWALADPVSGAYMFNDDLNYTHEDLPYAIQGGEQPCGAWAVTEDMPRFWFPNGRYKSVKISDVVHETGYNPRLEMNGVITGRKIPVTILSVRQDEKVSQKYCSWFWWLKTRPDAKVNYSKEAAVVKVRSERYYRGNGRVYHIKFSDGIREYCLHVGVPNFTRLKDGGPKYNSLGYR